MGTKQEMRRAERASMKSCMEPEALVGLGMSGEKLVLSRRLLFWPFSG